MNKITCRCWNCGHTVHDVPKSKIDEGFVPKCPQCSIGTMWPVKK